MCSVRHESQRQWKSFSVKISAAILHCLQLSSKVRSSPLLQRDFLINEDITILMCDWRFQSLTQKHRKIKKPTTPWQIFDLKNKLLCDFFHKTLNVLLGRAESLKFFQNRTKTRCEHNDLSYTLIQFGRAYDRPSRILITLLFNDSFWLANHIHDCRLSLPKSSSLSWGDYPSRFCEPSQNGCWILILRTSRVTICIKRWRLKYFFPGNIAG